MTEGYMCNQCKKFFEPGTDSYTLSKQITQVGEDLYHHFCKGLCLKAWICIEVGGTL